MKADALSLASDIWEALDTPRSLALWMCAKYRDHSALLTLKDLDPLRYRTPLDFFIDYQASKLLAKSVELKPGIDRELRALEKFKEAEAVCSYTNDFFRARSEGSLSMLPRVERVFSRARDKIRTILGDLPTYENLDLSFGPGASFGVRGDTSVYKKVTSNLECTYAMSSVLPDLLSEVPGWIEASSVSVQLVSGSELTFVPKDASIDRAICIEPMLNGFVQKGYGRWISTRLKSFGVDLSRQEVNQELAAKAYSHSLSTIDLSSASDTISYWLVLELLPWEWFEALDVVRCPSYTYQGVRSNFHKFSSMGNAYTFELETLLFYALACASCEECGVSYSTGNNLVVYGDDIIVPRSAFDLLTEVISACGFSVNKAKSYKDGPFFESCGADFFQGLPVRPIFFKEKIAGKLLRCFYAANSIRRFASRIEQVASQSLPYGRRLERSVDHTLCGLALVYDKFVAQIPHRLRVYGPEGCGDGHLISEWDECTPPRHPDWEGWIYRSYRERPVEVKLNDVPIGYALYFGRESITSEDRERRADKPFRHLLYNADSVASSSLGDLPNGRSYALRGRTSLISGHTFCASSWRGWRTIFDIEGTKRTVWNDPR